MTNLHLSSPATRLGPSPADAALTVIAVHGRGQQPAYLVEHLVRPVLGELQVGGEEIAWVLPAAHEGAWYPKGFMSPLAENHPQLGHALEVLDRLVDDLHGVPPGRIAWAGFSQGACLVTEWVARHPRRWAALLAFTGGRIGPAGIPLAIDADGGFDAMPAYFGTGAHDEWVPTPRVRDTVAAFRDAGAATTLDVFEDTAHEIRRAEIEQASRILGQLMTASL